MFGARIGGVVQGVVSSGQWEERKRALLVTLRFHSTTALALEELGSSTMMGFNSVPGHPTPRQTNSTATSACLRSRQMRNCHSGTCTIFHRLRPARTERQTKQ